MSGDLVEFIEARLAEDEQIALEPPTQVWTLAASATVDDGEDTWYVIDQRNARHVVRHDPARVLREVEAKRAIVALAKLYADEQFPDHNGGYADGTADAVAFLALPYADHPDYRAEWSPA